MRNWIVFVGVLLGGCATVPEVALSPPAIQSSIEASARINAFQLNGRVGVKYDEKGFFGNVRWQHDVQNDEILILSPLGQGVAQISQNSAGVTLITADQQTYHAQDAETLTEEVLGWRLPLKGLRDWVLGRKAAGEATITLDQSGRVSRLVQDGWQIDYLNYQLSDGALLPQKLTMQRGNLEMKLIVDHWDANQSGF
ncbi:lipoprotein insertase outer membrane protein LolB [Sulfurirhabdus autotrophica]|uniref:Outer-membrane lipoprotein LolB n=1 Tax=Sulfurirhabdus autotrophica TaxID=1706046 RepID=A0A4R3Y3M5_9PROT|nr:lipoprotein insertase outer membrane protein LolB [Sulfurirhabdus autotrophica]TCV84723.1 outer membrane lipoprotein LolB [Sulfurirhabdus autotrophica]